MLMLVGPIAAKVEATSGCESSHFSFASRISVVASRDDPGGVRNSMLRKPESDLGMNSPSRRDPARIASAIAATAIRVVFPRFARDHSRTFV